MLLIFCRKRFLLAPSAQLTAKAARCWVIHVLTIIAAPDDDRRRFDWLDLSWRRDLPGFDPPPSPLGFDAMTKRKQLVCCHGYLFFLGLVYACGVFAEKAAAHSLPLFNTFPNPGLWLEKKIILLVEATS
ncbi:hypothetical protein TNIN_181161 [Trichonephila inaurata madagascariensis]|uniref:Uncharacterized protein n=1 Tax=Trichonephila inaurata madagascariensis TaxID=2747483 RepID=A0A8X6XYF2_9ARAC|nr:hypothetical protein TNIN_181161 [Trichonephila inaurata madagascariensis]